MGDSGEGIVDAESRIQERMEELALERNRKPGKVTANPELKRALESLSLARTQLERQLTPTTHPARQAQIAHALEDLDQKIARLNGV